MPSREQEILDRLWRWREALAGAGVSAFGLWFAVRAFGFMQLFGYALVVAGAVVMLAGIQRSRFRTGAGGPGVVVVREAQVTYFGPGDGGTVNIGSLLRLELDPSTKPFPLWILTEAGMPAVTIPTTAENAEALFDVFASLPGIRTERMLAELGRAPQQRVVIWQLSEGATGRLRVH